MLRLLFWLVILVALFAVLNGTIPVPGIAGEEVAAAAVRRVPLPVDRRRERGPFDVIGDVRGRGDALVALLRRLGHAVELGPAGEPVSAAHPGRRLAVFTGDLAGGGPDDAGVVRLVGGMVAAGAALAVRGDRDEELAGCLPEPAGRFLAGLPSHLVLAGGRLVVAHAGVPASRSAIRKTASDRAYARSVSPVRST